MQASQCTIFLIQWKIYLIKSLLSPFAFTLFTQNCFGPLRSFSGILNVTRRERRRVTSTRLASSFTRSYQDRGRSTPETMRNPQKVGFCFSKSITLTLTKREHQEWTAWSFRFIMIPRQLEGFIFQILQPLQPWLPPRIFDAYGGCMFLYRFFKCFFPVQGSCIN